MNCKALGCFPSKEQSMMVRIWSIDGEAYGIWLVYGWMTVLSDEQMSKGRLFAQNCPTWRLKMVVTGL